MGQVKKSLCTEVLQTAPSVSSDRSCGYPSDPWPPHCCEEFFLFYISNCCSLFLLTQHSEGAGSAPIQIWKWIEMLRGKTSG